MPAKNAEPFISECIESIIQQTFKNWELIVVDDFSSDLTEKIILEFVKIDVRIRYVKNKKNGIIPALETAFELSQGQYVTRMDADDVMPIDKLELFLKEIQKHPNSIITGKVNYFSNDGVSEGYLRYENWLNSLAKTEDFYSAIYRECIIASPNWMVERSCFEKHFRFSDLKYPEDYDMVFKWYQNNLSIVAINKVTHLWREHNARTSRNHEAYQQESFFKLKTNYFVDIELKDKQKIQLIGAGVKGKLVAEIARNREVNFDWFDFKIDEQNSLQISSQNIKSIFELNSDLKTILTVWPKDKKTQDEILTFFAQRNFIFGKNVWLF